MTFMFFLKLDEQGDYSQVPLKGRPSHPTVWVGRTNPSGAGNKTLEGHNSKCFIVNHQKSVLFGKLHMLTSFGHWCHSLAFIGCPARSSFRSPPVCNFAMAVTVLLDLLIFIACICNQKHFHISCLQFSISPPLL